MSRADRARRRALRWREPWYVRAFDACADCGPLLGSMLGLVVGMLAVLADEGVFG